MMEYERLGIDGVWLIKNEVHYDQRGYFREWYKSSEISNGPSIEFSTAQASLSNSHKGVVRGIHFSLAKVGQAKWITCVGGAILDVVVDVRKNSKTFGQWISCNLKAGDGKGLLIERGLGHSFQALENDSVVTYLLSSEYEKNMEYAVNPLDPSLGIDWPIKPIILSERDENAPLLKDFWTRR